MAPIPPFLLAMGTFRAKGEPKITPTNLSLLPNHQDENKTCSTFHEDQHKHVTYDIRHMTYFIHTLIPSLSMQGKVEKRDDLLNLSLLTQLSVVV